MLLDRIMARWNKPDGLACKINWKATLDANNKKVGIEVIVRDSKGEILACLYLRLANNVAHSSYTGQIGPYLY